MPRDLDERGLAMLQRIHGEEHPDIAQFWDKLGDVLRLLGDTVGAVAAHRRAEQMLKDVLGSTAPRVATQLLDLAPWRPVSSQPPVCRDLSIVADAPIDAELLGDTVRTALGPATEDLESVTILATTGYADLPEPARRRLGLREDRPGPRPAAAGHAPPHGHLDRPARRPATRPGLRGCPPRAIARVGHPLDHLRRLAGDSDCGIRSPSYTL